MYNLGFKPILVAPALVALLTIIGATTTHAYASVDCSQSDDPRCQQATSSPPDFSHHSAQDVAFCIAAGSLLGIWVPVAAQAAPFVCQVLQ
jgi:hypothetical protein